MRAAIHQPQFLPWLGYLDKIDQVDVFVLLDNVQFKKNEWQNRNRIRTSQGWQWVTVPVHHRFGQRIDEVTINNAVAWRRQHLRSLEMCYHKAPCFSRVWPSLRDIYGRSWGRLADFNFAILQWILDGFGIKTEVRLASSMVLRETPTLRLVDICRTVGATWYLAGAGARDYMDVELFRASGLGIGFQDFVHPIYRQCYEPFIPGMASVDLLFNAGLEAIDCLRSTRRPPCEV